MPRKKKAEFGAKSAFVRSLPESMPAADVVDAARKKGITLTTGLIYNIRSTAKKSTVKKATKAVSQPRGRKGRARRTAGLGSAEVQLRNAIAALGITKTKEILAVVEATFAGR